MSDEITPVMTLEEWAEVLDSEYEPALFCDYTAADRPHRTAALCLYGQPFGFTREDVTLMRSVLATSYDGMGMGYYVASGIEGLEGELETEQRFASIIARIAALLPPEGTP